MNFDDQQSADEARLSLAQRMARNTSYDDPRAPDEAEPDYFLYFSVFMLVFWPVILLIGVIDFFFIADYDLRVVDLLIGVFAGWVAVSVYRAKEQSKLAS